MSADALLENPRNASVLQYLKRRATPVTLPSISPDAIRDPYMSLGTHPDLVSRLWNELTKELPVPCQWVVYGSPTLVRPDSSIIFAFAGGSRVYGLRLGLLQRAEMKAASVAKAETRADKSGLIGTNREKYLLAHSGDVHQYSNGSTFDITTLGDEWILGRWLSEEMKWCKSAYDNAA
jgi:hypothetical protein